jgi:acetate kinase
MALVSRSSRRLPWAWRQRTHDAAVIAGVEVRVIPTNEELMSAQHTLALICP